MASNPKIRVLPKKRQPVVGYVDGLELNSEDFIIVRERRTRPEQIKVRVADSNIWKPVRKKTVGQAHAPIFMFALVFDDRILFNGDGAIVCRPDADRCRGSIISDTKVVLVDTRSYRLVPKDNIKRLKPQSRYGVPTPHKSHRMTRWTIEVRAPKGTMRLYAVRKCMRCELEQTSHTAGCFSPAALEKRCNGQ